MACGGKSLRRLVDLLEPRRVDPSSLEETGRLQFFYHSPDSELPVRDVLNKHGKGNKTEPHLEKSAENYCAPCLQKNIRGFLNSSEKYLFLFTRRSRGSDRNRYVVGYLTKERRLRRFHRDENGREKPHDAVKGPIKLVLFSEAFLLKNLTGLSESAAARLRFKKLNKVQTTELLEWFKKGRDIFRECLLEVCQLKRRLNGRSDASRSHTCRS